MYMEPYWKICTGLFVYVLVQLECITGVLAGKKALLTTQIHDVDRRNWMVVKRQQIIPRGKMKSLRIKE